MTRTAWYLLPLVLSACGGGASDLEPAPPLTLRVPIDQPNLAAALAAAPDGYTIVLSKGTYAGPQNTGLTFPFKRLHLRGADGPQGVIVDCQGHARFITFDNEQGADASISALTIRNCNIDFQGAIYALNAAPSITGNVFETTMTTSPPQGAAVFGFGASPRIERNLFRNVGCDDQNLSGVLSFVNTSLPYIANNVFVGNPCRAINITVPETAAPVVVNNTLVGNRAGIYVDRRVGTAAHWYSNNLIVGNERGIEVAFEFLPRTDDLADVWRYNLLFANTVDYLGTADLTGVQGNLRVDPLLIGAPNDLRLMADSPAKDAGLAQRAPADDFDGRPRVGAIDIGAFELP